MDNNSFNEDSEECDRLRLFELMLTAGCEVTATVFNDGPGFTWLLPNGYRCEPTETLHELPPAAVEWLRSSS